MCESSRWNECDGNADVCGCSASTNIVWRHTNGQVAIWFMEGGTIAGEAYPGGQDPSLSWTIQGTGDFNADGHADILWRHVAGQFGGELGFDSPSYQNAHGPGDLSWQIQAIGDFDHDRRDDIRWRHTNGQVGIWLMDGVRFVGDEYPRLVDGAWQVKGLMRESGM